MYHILAEDHSSEMAEMLLKLETVDVILILKAENIENNRPVAIAMAMANPECYRNIFQQHRSLWHSLLTVHDKDGWLVFHFLAHAVPTVLEEVLLEMDEDCR